MQSQNFSPGSRKLPRHALTSPWCVWRTLCDDCPSRAAAVRAAAETCVTALLRGPGVGTCPRPHDPCRCTRFSAALSACPNDLSAALSVWCTESAIQACLAWLTRHTLTMRYWYCLVRETASGPIGRRSPDQPVPPHCRLDCAARRRSTSRWFCAPIGHERRESLPSRCL